MHPGQESAGRVSRLVWLPAVPRRWNVASVQSNPPKTDEGGVNASQPIRRRFAHVDSVHTQMPRSTAKRQKRPAYGGLTSRLGRVHPWDRDRNKSTPRLMYACAFRDHKHARSSVAASYNIMFHPREFPRDLAASTPNSTVAQIIGTSV